MSVVFDKLSFVKHLEDKGSFSRPQAEALAVSETVATKQDVASTRSDLEQFISLLRTDVQMVRTELLHEVSLVRGELKAGLAETKVWTVSVGATIIAVLAAMKYFG